MRFPQIVRGWTGAGVGHGGGAWTYPPDDEGVVWSPARQETPGQALDRDHRDCNGWERIARRWGSGIAKISVPAQETQKADN